MNCRKFHWAIQNYIDIVKGANVFGKPVPVCEEQKLLIDYVIKVFQEEDIRVNEEQLDKYLDLQKYFPFDLFPWETFCFALHNCVYKVNGLLRWPILFIYVGRGAGKNGYLAFEDFVLLTPVNGVRQYHIDIFAMAEDQAKTTFDDVYNVLEDNKAKLKNHFYWNKEEIINLKTKSKLKFRTSAVKSKDGGRPGKVDFDEYHAYETMKLVDVATTGLGKKAHPRRTIITTDGDVRDGPLDTLKAKALGILKGGIPDNGTLPFMCKLDSEKEINNKDMWPKANPSLIYLPTLQSELDIEFSDYIMDPVGNSSFATKRMNMPQGNKDIEVTSWDNILKTNRELPDLSGYSCICGIDYAKSTDFVSVFLLFKSNDMYYGIHHSWFCTRSSDKGRIKIPLDEMEKKGVLTIVDDVDIHPYLITDWIQEKKMHYIITKIAIDDYRLPLMNRGLREIGFDAKDKSKVKIVRPSDKMKVQPKINSIFANGSIAWGDDPLMRWFTNNTKLAPAQHGNYTYEKIEPRSRKNDGFMAFVAAMTIEEEIKERPKYRNIPVLTV